MNLKLAKSCVTGKPEVMADTNLTSDPQRINTEESILLRIANLGISSFLSPSLFSITYIWTKTYSLRQNIKSLFQHRAEIITRAINLNLRFLKQNGKPEHSVARHTSLLAFLSFTSFFKTEQNLLQSFMPFLFTE